MYFIVHMHPIFHDFAPPKNMKLWASEIKVYTNTIIRTCKYKPANCTVTDNVLPTLCTPSLKFLQTDVDVESVG